MTNTSIASMSSPAVPDAAGPVDADALRRRRAATSPGRRRASVHTGTVAPTAVAGAVAHLHTHAFATRESADYGFMLMDKMIEQTLDPYREVPGVSEALAIGAAILHRDEEGARIREETGAQLLYPRDRPRRWYGVRFEIKGTPFQWGLTSGAKTAIDGDNAWVAAVCEFIETTRPEWLITGPASRLARLTRLFGDIERSAQAARTKVCTAELPSGMDLTDLGGKASFTALANAAEFDYRATIMRLLTGLVFELKNNRYPRSSISLCPGYKLRGGKGSDRNEVLIDDSPATRKLVRRFIELAASDTPEVEMAAELAGLGLKSRWHTAPGIPADQVDDPARLIGRLFQALPTYLDGKHLFRHEVALENMDKIHGFEVHREHMHDNGFFEVTLDFGVPDGGWHDSELIKTAISKRLGDAKPSTVSSPRTTVKPLSGLVRYDNDGYEYILMANEIEVYEMRRRPVPVAISGKRPTFHTTDGDLVGRFNARGVHRALAEILRRLADGVPVTGACPNETRRDAGELAALDAEIERLEAQRDNARRELVATDDEQSIEFYRGVASDASEALTAATRQRTLHATAARKAPSSALDGGRIAALIRILEDLPGAAPVHVQHSLRAVIRKATFGAVEPATPLARMEVVLSLRTDTGVIASEPQHAFVRNGAVGGAPGTPAWPQGFKDRKLEIVSMLLLESVPEEERRALWDAEGFNGRQFQQRMHETIAGLASPEVASAIIDCPILDVRRAALRPYLDHDLPLSAAFPARLEEEVAAVYAKRGFSWTVGWCPGGMARARQLLTFIDRYQTDPELGLPLETLRSALQLSPRAIHLQAHTGPTPYGRQKPSPAPWYARIELHQAQAGDDTRKRTYVRIRECPHCGNRTLLQPLRVPEVAGYILCTAPGCRRALLSDVPYPDEFFEPWDGAQSAARRDPGQGYKGKRVWWTEGTHIVVGTTRAELNVPSLHAPRTAP